MIRNNPYIKIVQLVLKQFNIQIMNIIKIQKQEAIGKEKIKFKV